MSRTIGPKGQTMRTTVDARRRAPRLPSRLPSNASPTPGDGGMLDAALEAWKCEAFALIADDQGREMGKSVYTPKERHNARRRRDRAAEALAITPDGRAALKGASAQLAGPATRMAARMFAKAGIAFRPVIVDGFRLASEAIAKHDVTSTGATFATAHGLLMASGFYLETEAVEQDTRIMGVTKSTTENGVKATAALSGFRDLKQLALASFSKAAVMFEMMIRARDDARVVDKELRVAAQHRAWADQRQREESERRAKAALPERDEPLVVEAELDVTVPEPEPDDEERVAASAAQSAEEILRDGQWCPIRNRVVPSRMANTPRPSASSGPDWVARVQEEDDQIARFERDLEMARRTASARRK